MKRLIPMLGLGIILVTPSRARGQDSSGVPNCATTHQRTALLWCEGSRYFVQHDEEGYKKAIGPYSRALELEKAHRTLERNAWLVLIDGLGMSYGITGNLAKAKETFEYGLSQEPRYPMFYYNLACTYAEMGDETHAIANLRHAFEFRANMIPGEDMPDPSSDDSFQRFIRDSAFVAAVRSLPGRTQ